MNAVWKYRLGLEDLQQIEMPRHSKVLCVQTQYGVPRIWVQVAPTSARKLHRFAICGTGHETAPTFSTPHEYVGTFQLGGGSLVFHVFSLGFID